MYDDPMSEREITALLERAAGEPPRRLDGRNIRAAVDAKPQNGHVTQPAARRWRPMVGGAGRFGAPLMAAAAVVAVLLVAAGVAAVAVAGGHGRGPSHRPAAPAGPVTRSTVTSPTPPTDPVSSPAVVSSAPAGVPVQAAPPGASPTSSSVAPASGGWCDPASGVLLTVSPLHGATAAGVALHLTNTSTGSCTTRGYPGVDVVRADGTRLSAQRTLAGALGGVRSGTAAPSVVLRPGQQATAVIEGPTTSSSGAPCPMAYELLVTAPNTTSTRAAAAGVPACEAPQVHPMVLGADGGGAAPSAPTQVSALRPVTASGQPAAGWSVTPAGSVRCGGDQDMSAVSPDIYSCGASAENLLGCWRSAMPQTLLCLRDAASRELFSYTDPEALAEVAPPALPLPVQVTLDDGTTCGIRIGGAASSQQEVPGVVPYYFCGGDASRALWAPPSSDPFARGGTWTAQYGGVTGPLTQHAVVSAVVLATA